MTKTSIRYSEVQSICSNWIELNFKKSEMWQILCKERISSSQHKSGLFNSRDGVNLSGGQEIEFHEIEMIILLNWSGDRKGPRCPQGTRLGKVKGQVRLG
jgi:hypothetical protein